MWYAGSLCSLILYPRMQGVGITVDCGAQCAITSNFQNYQCAQHLVNELGIQQCNQVQCSPIVYNLSICITEENGITIGDTTTQITIRDGVINETTTRQPQTSSPTTVYRAETTNRIVSYTTKQLSSTEEQLLIGALVGLLVVILVLSTIPWIWTCWKLKVKGLKRDIRQAR